MKKRKGLWTWNRRSVTAALLAALVASTTIIPGFSSGGEIHLINDLGGFWGETSVEAQMERDWNEDIISVAKGAWLDAHAGEDRERHDGGYSATMSSLPDTGSMMATGSDLVPGSGVPAVQYTYDVFEDIDEGAAASAVASYLKKARKAEKANSGDFLRKMLKEAVIPEDGVPRDNDLKKEILALDKMNDEDYEVFRTDAEYTPAAGDIIFVAGRISTGEDSPASASDAPAPLQDLVVDTMATPSEMEQTVAETEITIVDSAVEEQLTLENLEELKKNERTKALKRNAKHAVLAGIIIAGPENTGSDKIHFIYSTDREKVEIGVISRNEVRIIGYADMEQLHDKYCGILEEIEEEAEEPEEETPEVIEKVPNEKTEYTWKNDVLTVTATLTDPEAIPDDAELVVTPVTRKTEGYNYQAYMDALTGEISSAAEENTILYDVAFLADETDENGEKTGRRIELQPENDKVSVSFRYSSAALTDEIGARDADKVKVVHLPLAEAAKENTDTTKDATAIAAADITPECLDASIAVGTNSGRIEFQTEGFSVFAITYTQLSTYVISSKGDKYVVTVTYDATAGIPDGAELRADEITEEDSVYADIQNIVVNGLEEGKESIPSHPVILDISIMYNEQKIEPLKGSTVKVEIEAASDYIKGLYSDPDSPVLVNEAPIKDELSEMEKAVQVLHLTNENAVDVMETKDEITPTGIVSSFSTDSFSNWLVYLDEDLASIDVTTNDSITLRPYTEWVWKSSDLPAAYQEGQWTFPSSDWNVRTEREYINNQWVDFTVYTHKTNGSSFRSFSKTDDQLNETYTVVTSVSLKAGTFDIQTNKGKIIHVNVTQGASSPKPDTVPGVSGLTVNLFDYDVPTVNGSFDFTHSGNLDDSRNKATSVFNNTVNIEHNLKFLGWGYDGDGHGVNSYTKDKPKQGIVKSELGTDGFPILNDGNDQGLGYLFNTNSHNSSVYAFPGADGLFQLDNQGYYYYNSNVNYAEYDQANNQFILYEHTYSQYTGGSNGSNAKPFGFFPFHEYDTGNTPQPSMNHNKDLNHHFGMSMSVDFQIPKDKQMEDKDGNKHDIVYEFSGDDDLWVFVDDELVLDIGGLHQPVTGSINFSTGEIKVHGVENITKTFSVGAHTMKMFYLERGGCDSNLSVRFNLPLVKGKAAVDLAKKSMTNDTETPDAFLGGAMFGVWENELCTGEPYMTATSDASGHIDFGYLPVKETGQKFYIKEMAPPAGYLLNTSVYTATAIDGSEQGTYVFKITDGVTEIEKMPQEPRYPIIRNGRPDPIELSVQKQWQNVDGSPIENPSGTAVFELKRHYYYVEGNTSIIKVYRVDKNWENPRKMEEREFAGNSTASVNWSYHQYYGWSKDGPYKVNDGSEQNKGNNSAQIYLPKGTITSVYIFDGNMGGQYEQFGVENITVTGTAPSSGADSITTGEGEDTEYQGPTISLPTSSGAWSGSFSDISVMEQKENRVYYYTYYIVEKTVPDGFEAVYVDGQGNPISNPESLQTNTNGSQTIINRKLMDVPITKAWDDFSGDDFTWTATFQLEQRELKVNLQDEDATDVITDWTPVQGKIITLTKGQEASFHGLPRFRTHSNGTVYRILYSVAETAYEVKEGGTVVAKWDAEHGHTIGHKYTPQFIQDAGGNEQGEKPYEIRIANTLHNPTVTNSIDLLLQKTWSVGGAPYNPGNDAFATFILKRYVREEYRNYSHVTDMTDTVTVTLNVGGTGDNPTINVPRGAILTISGNVLAGQNATIEFKREGGTVLSKQINNTTSQSIKPFGISFEATQDETVSLIRGDNYVSGGREGFRLTDHGDQSIDKVDNHFSQEFTLSEKDGWSKNFSELVQIEEDEMDEVSKVQTITVYTYYFEETSWSPESFRPVFRTANGQMLGDENNPVDTNQSIIVDNQASVALPATGGPGSDVIYLFGTVLVTLAGAGLLMRRRKYAA